jgi:hypothetical protein
MSKHVFFNNKSIVYIQLNSPGFFVGQTMFLLVNPQSKPFDKSSMVGPAGLSRPRHGPSWQCLRHN